MVHLSHPKSFGDIVNTCAMSICESRKQDKRKKTIFLHDITACYVFCIINIDNGFKIRTVIGVMPAPWHFMGLPREDGRTRSKVLNRRVWNPFSASNSHVFS